MKTLYEAYDQNDVAMEEFAGVTMDELSRADATFETNVCVCSMDGCINYPSLGSIRVSTISVPPNSSSYPTSCPR